MPLWDTATETEVACLVLKAGGWSEKVVPLTELFNGSNPAIVINKPKQ